MLIISQFSKEMLKYHVTRELQIKTMRYHYTPFRITYVQTLATPNPGEDAEQQEFSFTASGNVKWMVTLADS